MLHVTVKVRMRGTASAQDSGLGYQRILVCAETRICRGIAELGPMSSPLQELLNLVSNSMRTCYFSVQQLSKRLLPRSAHDIE